MCYDGVLQVVTSLGEHCTQEGVLAALEAHGFNYDNINISTSIFVEQRGAATPAKVTSGTFGVLYKLRNANSEHMLLAPMMTRLKDSPGLDFDKDIRPSLYSLRSMNDQLVIHVVDTLLSHVPPFESLRRHSRLQHVPCRPYPHGHKTQYYPLRATTIEEATVRGNLLFHDEIYLNQLGRTSDSLNRLAIPSFNDQLTNARIRAAQILRSKDTNSWNRRDVFQLGFGLFHLCMNLIWALLHTHRGSLNDTGSLSYFFALLEKTRLGNDQPDYHNQRRMHRHWYYHGPGGHTCQSGHVLLYAYSGLR